MIAMHPYSMQACNASLQAVCIYLLAHVSRDGRGDDDDEGGSEVDDGDLGYEVAGGVPVQTSLDVDHQQDDVEDDPTCIATTQKRASSSTVNISLALLTDEVICL